jgi:hypothetical protein
LLVKIKKGQQKQAIVMKYQSLMWSLRMTAVCSIIATSQASAAVYWFDNVSDWGGTSKVDISQSAYDNGSGTAADISSWTVCSWLFNDLDGAGLHGAIKSSDAGVSISATFTLSLDKKNLLLDMTVMASDTRYSFSTWPEYDVTHGAMALGWDVSHNGGSYWEHTTQGKWSAVPEPGTYLAGLSALGMLGLFGWRHRK